MVLRAATIAVITLLIAPAEVQAAVPDLQALPAAAVAVEDLHL